MYHQPSETGERLSRRRGRFFTGARSREIEMASEIVAGLGAFKAMFDLAKGLKDISDATARNAVAIELQEGILTVQAQQAALVKRVGELEAEVGRFETWETEKQRYELTDFGGGTFAYALKKGVEPPEPEHRICPRCYENRQRSILQFQHQTATRRDVFQCPACEISYSFGIQHPFEGGTVESDFDPFA